MSALRHPQTINIRAEYGTSSNGVFSRPGSRLTTGLFCTPSPWQNPGMEPTREQKIWQVVLAIPEGRVASYGQVADMAGLGRQARFVGRALGKLPSGHAVPWFRVIRNNGQIAFPEGSEIFLRQQSLLEKEGVEVVNGRVAMGRFRWQP